MTTLHTGARVRIGPNPGTEETPGSGYVASEAAGATGTIVEFDFDDATADVEIDGVFFGAYPASQWIHVAHLTLIEAAE